MGYYFAKVFGPTDSVASVVAGGRKKTQIGSDYLVPPGGPFHIHKMFVSKGNVVDAKECAGIVEIHVTSVTGTFEYAYGNGTGGTTNGGGNIAAEPINCRIPAPSGSKVSVYVNDAEIAKNVTIECNFWSGAERIDSYAVGGGTYDATAATELTLPTVTIVDHPGLIKEIRFAGAVIADAEAGSAKLVVEVPAQGYPQEFAVGNGPGGATLGAGAWADVKEVNIGTKNQGSIPVNTVINFKLTAAEDLKSPTVSIAVK